MAAYAEAVSDGVADELRRRLFRAIWVQGPHLSSADEVRRLVSAAMWPQEDIAGRLASPDFPSLLLHDPDLTRIVRRSGGTIAWDGQPLTTVGLQRIRQWRQEWLALPSQLVPAVTARTRSCDPVPKGCATWLISPAPRAARRSCPCVPAPGRTGTPALRRSPGRPDRAASAAGTGGGPARARHAASGKAGTGPAAGSVTARSVRNPAVGGDTADG